MLWRGLGFKMLDGFEGDGELRRFDRLEEPLRHRGVNPIAPHALAGCASKIFMHLGAHRDGTDAIGHVAHRPATAAHPTAHDALQQGAAFAHDASVLVGIARPIIVELFLVVTKLAPADRTGMMITKERVPVVALDLSRVPLDAGGFARQGPLSRLRAPIDLRPGVERIVQDREHACVTESAPHHRALALALPQPRRELQSMLVKRLHHR
jgi:hypothetical protein